MSRSAESLTYLPWVGWSCEVVPGFPPLLLRPTNYAITPVLEIITNFAVHRYFHRIRGSNEETEFRVDDTYYRNHLQKKNNTVLKKLKRFRLFWIWGCPIFFYFIIFFVRSLYVPQNSILKFFLNFTVPLVTRTLSDRNLDVLLKNTKIISSPTILSCLSDKFEHFLRFYSIKTLRFQW